VALILLVQNDGTGTRTTGQYRVEARLNARVLATGHVVDFPRDSGWWALLVEAIDVLRAVPPP